MNEQEKQELDALVQEKISADNDFQESLADLSDEDKEARLAEKRTEVLELSVLEFKSDAAKKAEIAENQKKRAEKAEGKGGKQEPPQKNEGSSDTAGDALSTKDTLAIMEAKIPSEDVDELVRLTKGFGFSDVTEALKDDTIMSSLKKRAEVRATKNAAGTGAQRPGTKKVTAEKVTQDLSEGKAPEPGSPEAEELFWARRGGRRS